MQPAHKVIRTVSCPWSFVAVQMSHHATELDHRSASTVCMHSSSAWRRTNPIAATARGTVELLAFETDDKGGGRGKVRKGIEGVVASLTGPIIEFTAARAVWHVRARVVSCTGVQNSDLSSIASSSSASVAIAVTTCRHFATRMYLLAHHQPAQRPGCSLKPR